MKAFIHSIVVLPSSLLSVFFLNAQVVQINQTFSSDTIINPFTGSPPVYSLSLNGGITLNSDSSLVRVVLIDTWGNHYMVFESYPLITIENVFDTLNAADETTYLDGAVCDSLRIDIINATIDLDSLKLDTNYIPNASELQILAKWDHDSVKIDIINHWIEEENMYWRAGRTSIVDLFFKEKENIFGSHKFSFEGFEFYKGGIFEFFSDRNYPESVSEYVKRFDWRERHGANTSHSPYFTPNSSPYYDEVEPGTGWLTKVWNQPCDICTAYGSIGALEARVNLFYNHHYSSPLSTYQHIDLDLSEWDVVECNPGYSCYNCPPIGRVLLFIKNYGVVDEECLEFPDDCIEKCDESEREELVKIENYDTVKITSTNEDWIKYSLIKHGPLICTVIPFTLDPNQDLNHAMTLVGFKPLNEYDIAYKNPENPNDIIIIDPDSPLIGVSSWIFKNSWGESWGENGFTNMPISNDKFLTGSYNFKILGEIYREDHTNAEIQCVDEDGDGYYWWGIRHDPPEDCNHNPEYRDCDDSDPSVGPYNLDPNEGPLYECKPICENFSYSPYYIDENLTIIEDRHFNCDLIVMPGNTVTINNSTISFSEQARFIIRQNAKVILNNSTLTTKCTEVMWHGVEVWGNSTYSQTDPNYQQGIIEINNSTIEKALCGVTTVKYEYTPESGGPIPIPTFSGGIILAVSSTFRNNKVAVEFYPYDFDNISYFNECEFETDFDYLEGENPEYFVKITGVKEIPFICCSFVNARISGNFPWYVWGGGIYSFNSSFIISDDGCNTSPKSSVFHGLTRGIYALNSGSNTGFTVKETDFTDNYRSIYCSGITSSNSLTIVSNNFKVCKPPEYIETHPYGLYLENCSGYHIEDNVFWPNSAASWNEHVTIGLIVNNSGTEDNLIYRNTFHSLNFGIIAQNNNRSADGWSGLEFKCNIFSTDPAHFCYYDLSITTSGEVGNNTGIKRIQGSNLNDPTEPAGNIFSDEINPPIGQYQLINHCSYFTYYYHTYDNGYIIEPMRYYYTDIINPQQNQFPLIFIPDPNDPNSSCPSALTDNIGDPDSLRQKLFVLENCIDSTETALESLIDGGNTNVLASTVQLSWPPDSIPLRNDLLLESPYLSDTVMINSINKEDVLTSEMVTEILSANPHAPKSDKVMQAVAERNNILSEEQLASIFEGFNYSGEVESLEMDIADMINNHKKAIDNLVKYYRDTLPEFIAIDSIVGLLTSHGNLQKHYNAIIECLSINDPLSAWQKYNAIPSLFILSSDELAEYEYFEDYLSVRTSMINNGFNIMNPDSIMKNGLYNLLNTSGKTTSAFARNMLIATDTLQYTEPIILPEPSLKEGNRIRFVKGPTFDRADFSVYPNPASTYVIAHYDYLKPGNTGRLDVVDGSGRICLHVSLRPGTKYEVINIEGLSPGIYFCTYTHSGSKKYTCKLVITR